MDNWRDSKIEELCTLHYGKSPKGIDSDDGIYPIYGTGGIVGSTNDYLYDKPSIILGRKGSIGNIHYVDKPFWTIDTTFYVEAKNCDTKWLYYVFSSLNIEKLNEATGVPSLSRNNIYAQMLKAPSDQKEQQKIAEVLSTVDKKIDLIDKKIAETEKLKTGLMQKLFSEGVGVQDENGNWQPHTEFQDSPFGKIPQPWSTLELAEIADIEDGDRGKSYPKQADFSDFGYCLFLSAKNVTKQGFTYETTQFISQEKHNKLRKGQVLQNDIVLTTRGTVGNFGLFKHEELFDAVRINSGMAIIRCIDSSMPNYLYQFMQSPQFKAQISKVVFGSAQPQLTIKQIKKFKVLVPISEEKKWIEETLKLANDKLTLLEQQKAETQQLKKGLMQKLLTGEWRVTVEETEAA
ncbi:restriction endonuclease subunit S [Vibrio sp. 2art]|uniref:restriction endonuclease subunit S n=1 Tax=Vibrio sp. 2art TaxID=2998832 RepID=UPI0022CD67F5|nr:restriction endonuclease subunit S [Vibrio sp. 2art]MDA0114675.1 restriction endonuclease subunit S [Vibrio sp. 2art]